MRKKITMAAAALTLTLTMMELTACSVNDNEMTNHPAIPRLIPFEATVSASEGNNTRTIITEGTGPDVGKLTVAWEVGDSFALICNGTKTTVSVETVNEDGTATISGIIDCADISDGDDVLLVYPADAVASVGDGISYTPNTTDEFLNLWRTQDGTLDYIGKNHLDRRQSSSTSPAKIRISSDPAGATLDGISAMENMTTIWELNLTTDGTTPLEAETLNLTLGGTLFAGAQSSGRSQYYLCVDPSMLTNLYADSLSQPNIPFYIEATVGEDTYVYATFSNLNILPGRYYTSTMNLTKTTGKVHVLNSETKDVKLNDGDILFGWGGQSTKVTITSGASVTFQDVNITSLYFRFLPGYPGIKCWGDATITLKGTNKVKGYRDYPGIYIPREGTLTIQGDGSLEASSDGMAAGIGAAINIGCGNIVIKSGNITATGGNGGAGIGGAPVDQIFNEKAISICGNITITGGTVTATGGDDAPGIGAGYADVRKNSSCGVITITGGTVTAKAGSGYARTIYTTHGNYVKYAPSAIGTANVNHYYDIVSSCEEVNIGRDVTSVTMINPGTPNDYLEDFINAKRIILAGIDYSYPDMYVGFVTKVYHGIEVFPGMEYDSSTKTYTLK